MKTTKIQLTLLAMVLLFASCEKDPTESGFERGKIISYAPLGTKTIDEIKFVFTFLGIADSIDYQYSVQVFSVKYQTISATGAESFASGLVVVPNSTAKSWPLVSFHHGTELKKSNVPSRLVFGSGYEVALMFATEGYVACSPDYLGLGDGEGLHPYVHAKSEASASIDMLRACKNLCTDLGIKLNSELFLIGYSQGAHASMATQKEIEANYASEFSLTANAHLAGPFDLSGIMADVLLAKEDFGSPVFLPYVLYSYNSIYNIYTNPATALKAPYNSTIPPFFDGRNLNTITEVNTAMPSIPSDIFTDEAYAEIKNKTNTKFWSALEDNDLYDWTPKAPILLCHCADDATVPPENSAKALQSFEANGVTNTKLIDPLPTGTHQTCIIPSLLAAKHYFNSKKSTN